MNPEVIIVSFILFFIGIISICLGLYALFGPVHMWYILRNPFMTLGLYSAIPGGLFLITLALLFYIPEQVQGIFIFSGLFLAFLGPFVMATPKLKPTWFQWLNQEHGDILDVL